MKDIRVVELFAGVGGFRVGLESADPIFKTIWANQFEPSQKQQLAAKVYREHFQDGSLVVQDIATVESQHIPDCDLLVGGYPCTDYSRSHKSSLGIKGKAGNLWWEIDRIIGDKAPEMILLENVDTVLSSPGAKSPYRGRDFAQMLATFLDHGYVTEWRVIAGSDYGGAQRRYRIFIMAAKRNSPMGMKIAYKSEQPNAFLNTGFFADQFPAKRATGKMEKVGDKGDLRRINIHPDVLESDAEFSAVWGNAGAMVDGHVTTRFVNAEYNGPQRTIRDILEANVKDNYTVPEDALYGKRGWAYAKGAKKGFKAKQAANKHISVKEADMQELLSEITGETIGPLDWCWTNGGAAIILQGHAHIYDASAPILTDPIHQLEPVTSIIVEAECYPWSEGAVAYPDSLDNPSRTITKSSLAGTSASREKHIILDPETEKLRVLTPLEAERLQGFPDGWTANIHESWRYQTMGNALVVDVIKGIGTTIAKWHREGYPIPQAAARPKIEEVVSCTIETAPEPAKNIAEPMEHARPRPTMVSSLNKFF